MKNLTLHYQGFWTSKKMLTNFIEKNQYVCKYQEELKYFEHFIMYRKYLCKHLVTFTSI